MTDKKPKLDKGLVTKDLLALERRLITMKRLHWAIKDKVLVIPSKQPLESSKLLEDCILYTSVSHNDGFWIITHQFDARAILPEDPQYTEEAGIDIMEHFGNILSEHVKLEPGYKLTEWKAEKDFVLNKHDPDYEGIVLTATIIGADQRGASVSGTMLQIRNLDDAPQAHIEVIQDAPKA